MAKPNVGRKDSKYMKQQIDKGGPNWIALKSQKDMYNDMPRILSGLANLNIDVEQYSYVWLSEQFKGACMQYCCDQMNILSVLGRNYNVYSMSYQLTEYDIGNMQAIFKKYEAMEYIYKTIQSVIYTCSYAPIKTMQVTLNKQYRNYVQRATTIW